MERIPSLFTKFASDFYKIVQNTTNLNRNWRDQSLACSTTTPRHWTHVCMGHGPCVSSSFFFLSCLGLAHPLALTLVPAFCLALSRHSPSPMLAPFSYLYLSFWPHHFADPIDLCEDCCSEAAALDAVPLDPAQLLMTVFVLSFSASPALPFLSIPSPPTSFPSLFVSFVCVWARVGACTYAPRRPTTLPFSPWVITRLTVKAGVWGIVHGQNITKKITWHLRNSHGIWISFMTCRKQKNRFLMHTRTGNCYYW